MFPSTPDRFWAKVNKDGPIPSHVPEVGKCWIWMGAKRPSGHGTFMCYGKIRSTHRYSYELHKGEIPEGHGVLHRCDNGACVNPDHLFTGTQTDNMRDVSAKGRTNQGEKCHFSKLNKEQVLEMRRLYDVENKTIKEIMEIFKAGRGAVSKVVHRERWNHI